MASGVPETEQQSYSAELARNLLAGLTVSFVAISLGAAFGILSERGAFAGILSAGIIALITAAFGGTRVQTSGPTAPMTAVTVIVVSYAYSRRDYAGKGLAEDFAGADPVQFINLVLLLTGILLLLCALFRLGRFIQYVPKVVISGFMNGIAILIWVDQTKKLFGLAGEKPIEGDLTANVLIAVGAFLIAFYAPSILGRFFPRGKAFLPGTLLAIAVVTVVVQSMSVDVQFTKTEKIGNTLEAWGEVVERNVPVQWDLRLLMLALPFALQLMLLCYLDTLLTSLVMDKKMTEKFKRPCRTRQDQELAAQGVANSAVSLFGGIPGAQATIRSVLILNEGATWRIAGVFVGIFVLIEMLIFQDYISTIPVAVFTGILFKVGYDVFDWPPLVGYVRGWVPGQWAGAASEKVYQIDMLFIVGTTLVTVLANLNIAVISFTVLFYLIGIWFTIPDLESNKEEFTREEPADDQDTT